MEQVLNFTLNGKPVFLTVDGSRMLLWVLRIDASLTGTKYGCGKGLCGSCTVLIDGKASFSCLTPALLVQGKEVLTIEGVEHDDDFYVLQEAFMDKDALQCGYCTPGMIMAALAFLKNNSSPNRSEIISAMEGNLCRCGCYGRIIEAIELAAGKLSAGRAL